MTPEERQAIRLRAMKDCPHWKLKTRPCRECEVVAAITEEREACAQTIHDRVQPLTIEDTSYEVIEKKMRNDERMACMAALRARAT